jgi:hypothetical protein
MTDRRHDPEETLVDVRLDAAGRTAATLLARIYADLPDAPEVAARGFDLGDRRAVRAVVAGRARRRRA